MYKTGTKQCNTINHRALTELKSQKFGPISATIQTVVLYSGSVIETFLSALTLNKK